MRKGKIILGLGILMMLAGWVAQFAPPTSASIFNSNHSKFYNFRGYDYSAQTDQADYIQMFYPAPNDRNLWLNKMVIDGRLHSQLFVPETGLGMTLAPQKYVTGIDGYFISALYQPDDYRRRFRILFNFYNWQNYQSVVCEIGSCWLEEKKNGQFLVSDSSIYKYEKLIESPETQQIGVVFDREYVRIGLLNGMGNFLSYHTFQLHPDFDFSFQGQIYFYTELGKFSRYWPATAKLYWQVKTYILDDDAFSGEILTQTDARWSELAYGKNTGRTIGDWGCLLTALSQVLEYYGYNTSKTLMTARSEVMSPATLQRLLVAESDGFIQGGLINWSALTRVILNLRNEHQNRERNLPKFEIEVVTGTQGEMALALANDMKERRPAIVELTNGHFVTVINDTDPDFGEEKVWRIADPYYTNIKTLAEYKTRGIEIVSVRRMIPSQTDLSYLIFWSDKENLEFNLWGSNGEKIELQKVTEKIVGRTSGTATKEIYQYLVAKPADDNYQLEIKEKEIEGENSAENFGGAEINDVFESSSWGVGVYGAKGENLVWQENQLSKGSEINYELTLVKGELEEETAAASWQIKTTGIEGNNWPSWEQVLKQLDKWQAEGKIMDWLTIELRRFIVSGAWTHEDERELELYRHKFQKIVDGYYQMEIKMIESLEIENQGEQGRRLPWLDENVHEAVASWWQ